MYFCRARRSSARCRPEVYRHLADEFDAQYPPARRCDPKRRLLAGRRFPDPAFAFSADGIFHKPPLSRSVTALDFSDPVWLRLGFINEVRYNWYTAAPDVHRADRDRRFWMGCSAGISPCRGSR